MLREYKREKIVIAVPHMRIRYKMKRRNMERIQEILTMAKEKGSKLVILPTMFHLGPVLDSPVERDPRKYFKKSYAERIPGSTTDMLRLYSEKTGVTILAGPIIERAGPRLYITSVLITPTRGVIAKYRKIVLGSGDLGLISSGNELVVADVGILLGLMSEEDLLVPEIAHALSIAGSEIIISFSKLSEDFKRYRSLLIARAVENSIHVVGLGGIVSSNGHDFFEIPTMIIDPEGEIKDEIKGFEEITSILEIEKRGTPRRDLRRDVSAIKKVYSWLKRKKILGAEL